MSSQSLKANTKSSKATSMHGLTDESETGLPASTAYQDSDEVSCCVFLVGGSFKADCVQNLNDKRVRVSDLITGLR
jgi:hypothetical protein